MKSCHGGDIYSYPVKYDFSANINPLGLPQSVKNALAEAIANGSCEHYPDVHCTALRNALAEREGVLAEQIVCGGGAADLIYRIAYALRPKKALLPAPTFSEYEAALRCVGCQVEYFILSEKTYFALGWDFLDRLDDIDIVFLCNPNNPVGNVVNAQLMKCIIQKCAQNRIYLVVDECFMDFVEGGKIFHTKADQDNIIVLNAFTKIYAMAGLRLGYAICGDSRLPERLQSCGSCWNVSVPAQIAGMTALRKSDYIAESAAYVARERRCLADHLTDFGFKVYPSEANFMLLQCGLPLDLLLRKEQIAIRNCRDYSGLTDGFFRIAVRTHEENAVLLQTIERNMQKWRNPS